MKAVLRNHSPHPRTTWAELAVPNALAKDLPDYLHVPEVAGYAVKRRRLGDHSTMFSVRCTVPASESVVVDLVAPTTDETAPAYMPHPWVADDLLGLVATLCVKVNDGTAGGAVLRTPIPKGTVTRITAAAKEHYFVVRVPNTPLLLEAWVTVYSDDPVAPAVFKLTNTDPRTPELNFSFEGACLETGEYLKVYFAPRVGVATEPAIGGGLFGLPLCGPMTLGDGQSMAFYGAFLCSLEWKAPTLDANLPEPIDHVSQGNLVAASFGPVTACLEGEWSDQWGPWQLHWGPFGYVPETPTSVSGFDEIRRREQIEADAGIGHMFDSRRYGLAKDTGQTGTQDGFGSAKGWQVVTAGDPGWLHWGLYHVSEPLRPTHNHEVNGSLVRSANHPGWWTFSQRTWFTGTDYLGKPARPIGLFSWGWGGNDDQHRANLELSALYALTGNPLLESEIANLVEVDLAMVPNRSDAARAVGRRMISWAWFYKLTLDPRIDNGLIQRLFTWFLWTWDTKRDKPVCPMEVYTDLRVLGGTPAWMPWQEAILCQGLYAAWKVTGKQELFDAAMKIGRNVVEHATFKDAAGWHFCQSVRWMDGEVLPASSYVMPVGTPGSPGALVGETCAEREHAFDRGRVVTTTERLRDEPQGIGEPVSPPAPFGDIEVWDGWWSWTMPCVRIVGRHAEPGLVKDKCEAIMAEMPHPTSFEQSDWWCV